MPEPSADVPPAPVIVPCDPLAGFRAQQTEIEAACRRVLAGGHYILGREVAAFEQEFAAYLAVPHAVGVANGTDAIQLALRACGIGPGDVVLTVSHTAVATVAAIELCGATPVLVDIDPERYTMDPRSLADALQNLDRHPQLRGRARAVIPVHLYGLPANMHGILQIARQHDLWVVEDGSQAHGAAIDGQKVGTLGDVAAFSLYPTKNLGAYGDAGIIATPSGELAEQVRLLREYGWRTRNSSAIPGMNSRLDELQAAMLRVRLERLEFNNRARRAIAAVYDTVLAGTSAVLPSTPPGLTPVYHQYVIGVPDRDRIRTRLAERGISTLIHYAAAVHQQPAYRDRLPGLVSLANTEVAVQKIISLPMYPELSLDSAQVVANTLRMLLEAPRPATTSV